MEDGHIRVETSLYTTSSPTSSYVRTESSGYRYAGHLRLASCSVQMPGRKTATASKICPGLTPVWDEGDAALRSPRPASHHGWPCHIASEGGPGRNGEAPKSSVAGLAFLTYE
jgi:hypothetical protein